MTGNDLTRPMSQTSAHGTKLSSSFEMRVPMPTLTDDVLRIIFQNLSDARDMCYVTEVCKQWYRVALSNRELWSRLSLCKPRGGYAEYEIPQKRRADYREGVSLAISVMTRRGYGQLRELNLLHVRPSKFNAKSCDLWNIERECGGALEVLKLDGAVFSVSRQVFQDVMSSFPRLRVLHVPYFNCLDVSALDVICSRCRILEEVDVGNCIDFSPTPGELAKALLPVRKTLRSLTVTRTGVQALPLFCFGTEFPKMQELYADECISLCQGQPGFDEFVDDTVDFFPNLAIFSMNNGSRISLKWINVLFESVKTLQSFSVDRSTFISSMRPFTALLRGPAPRLKTLSLAYLNLTDEYWYAIVRQLSSCLERCDLSHNRHLTGALPSGFISDRKLTRLVTLNVSCTSFNDRTVRETLKVAPNLDFFLLTGCRLVTDRRLRHNPLNLDVIGCEGVEEIDSDYGLGDVVEDILGFVY